MNHKLSTMLFVAVLSTVCAAQGKVLKVFISPDMEGIDGVSTWDVQASAKGREYEEFRRLMTQEVNAAVEGAFDAGATEVLVADSHGDAQNIDISVLDRRAQLINSRLATPAWDDARH
jgi:D-aminopeptidase